MRAVESIRVPANLTVITHWKRGFIRPRGDNDVPEPISRVRDLHSMVGLGRHATTAELKYAYEQAVAAAVRSGDHKHALSLSTAYDALSSTRRKDIYGAPSSLSPVRTCEPIRGAPPRDLPSRTAVRLSGLDPGAGHSRSTWRS